MEYAKRKKELLESLIVKETESSFSDLLPTDKVVLSKEEVEAEELIQEVIAKYRYLY